MASHGVRTSPLEQRATTRMGKEFSKQSAHDKPSISSSHVKLFKEPKSTGVARRRKKQTIREKLKILQELVIPGGPKMDTASMLNEAVMHVQFLKQQIWLHELLLSSFDALRSSSVDQLVSPEDACISAASLCLCQTPDLLLDQSTLKPVDASAIEEDYNFSLIAASLVCPDCLQLPFDTKWTALSKDTGIAVAAAGDKRAGQSFQPS
ncbi:hypothetical protein O6H91_17G084700 [Diphasiastrum complanatum]|uniref:Uncharacterized protein n=1 Tax=Diphasiastrum complanatum TaxID=34168 RepID=A0ACC2B9M2_DIPCM|nr:hypothetical protein O6H91_17G084700 [Diphasiastrum complanatum]